MTALYANENFPIGVVLALRSLGYDVLTSQEIGKSNQRIADTLVLSFAVEMSRALLTINRRDFIRLHREKADHSGIIVCTQDEDIPGQAERIHQAIVVAGDLTGKLVRVNRSSK